MQPAVIPFQIIVGGHGPDGYLLRASAAGRTTEARLVPPDPMNDIEELGKAMGRALFPKPVWQFLLDIARGADESGARLQLQLHIAPPELAVLPWEWLTLGNDMLWQPAIRDDYALVRVGRRVPNRPTLTVSGPLRLLIVAAPGTDERIDPLSAPLSAVARSGALVVDLLRDATPSAIAAALEEEPGHLLHIIAPISSGVRGETRIRLGRGVEVQALIDVLEPHRDLRLVTFAGGDAVTCGTLSAVFHERSGLATIGLDGKNDATNAAFAAACYATLSRGEPIDLAVTEGRLALADQQDNWGMPRLYLRPGGENLFDMRPDPDQPTPIEVGQPIARPRSERRPDQNVRNRARTARFNVAATGVGKPAQRMIEAARKTRLLQPQVIALFIAGIILAVMVYFNLERPEPPVPIVPTIEALTPGIDPLPTLRPTIE